MNPYRYANANSFKYKDSTGLDSQFVFFGTHAHPPGRFTTGVEGAGLFGYNSDNGFFSGGLDTGGYFYEDEPKTGSLTTGSEWLHYFNKSSCSLEDNEKDAIYLLDVGTGEALPIIGGEHLFFGLYGTPNEWGVYGGQDVTIFGQTVFVGAGVDAKTIVHTFVAIYNVSKWMSDPLGGWY